MSSWREAEVEFAADDGWVLGGVLRAPSDGPVPGVLGVPASLHERDAYTATAAVLEERGLASLRLDVRGRGSSLGDLPFARMAPLQRRRITLDVAAALEQLAAVPGVDPDRIALLGEQDTAADAVEAVAGDARVRAVVLMSARHGDRIARALATRSVSIFGLVSTEDRRGLRGTVDAYLAGDADSRIDVFDGLGIGVTMMSVLQFEQPDAKPLEAVIADWLAGRLG